MKRFCLILSFLNVAFCVSAQQPVDYLLKASALIHYGKNSDAISLLTKGISEYKDYRFFLMRAEAYVTNGYYAEAMKDYQSANSEKPSSGEYGLSRLYALKGDANNSLNHLEMNMASQFKKGEKEVFLDKAFVHIENTAEWRLFWKKERYSSTEEKISEIEFYVSAGKTDEAANILTELKTEESKNPDLIYAGALVDLSRGKYIECISSVTKLLETDKKNEKYLRLLAKAQFSSGNPSGASNTYTELISDEVIDAGLYISRAECYNKTGETEKALKDVSRFLDLYPDDKNTLRLAGKIEASSGDNLKAIEYFSRNLKLHPEDPECYIDRGNSYLNSGTWDNAINDYSMALDIQPANSDVWLSKAISLLKIGKTDDACHDFSLALTLGNKKAAGYINRYCIK